MYCKNCGKRVDGDSELCADCSATQAREYNTGNGVSAVPSAPTTDTLMYGFGKSLASTIMGFIGFILALVLYFVALFVLIGGSTGSFIACVFFSCVVIVLVVLSMYYGVKSIKLFIAQKNAGKKKPVPTLVLGIVGVVWAGISIIWLIIDYFLISAVLIAML